MNYSDNYFVSIFFKFLDILKVNTTYSGLDDFLTSHPDNGALIAYRDALNYYMVENAAFHITVEDLSDIPTPLITLHNAHGGRFTIIKSVNDGRVVWLKDNNRWVTTGISEFTADWSGNVLYAQPSEKSGEPNYRLKRKKEFFKTVRIPLAVFLSFVLFSYFILSVPIGSLLVNILLFVKLIGVVLASLLFIKSTGTENKFVSKICKSGSKVDCKSILESRAASITSWLTWSDMGFIYFFGSLIGLLLARNTGQNLHDFLSLQVILSSGGMLFSFYSLYYQKVKSRAWCTLCLGVVTVFAIEYALLLEILSEMNFSIGFIYHSHTFIAYIFPIVLLLLFKLPLTERNHFKNAETQLKKLKTNPKVIASLMSNQKQMPEIKKKFPKILLGNPSAKNTITFVSNPFCRPCANMHFRVENLVDNYKEFKCEIIFFTSSNHNNLGEKFINKIFDLPLGLRKSALHKWYASRFMNYSKWIQDLKNFNKKPKLQDIPAIHSKWIKEARIRSTPTLFFNGISLPEDITIEDLPFLKSHLNWDTSNQGFANQCI